MKNYEAMIIMPGNMEENATDEKTAKIKDKITELGGGEVAFTRMGRRNFARPLKKKSAGIYILANFRIAQERMPALQESLNLFKRDGDIFRFQFSSVRGGSRGGKDMPDSRQKEPGGDKNAAT